MSPATKVYVGTVIAAGLGLLVAFAPRISVRPLLGLTFLAAMLVVSVFKLRLPLGSGNSTMSMAYIIDFTVLITAGWELAMAIAAVGVLVQCTVRVTRRQPWYRAAFSVASVVLAVGASGAAWALLEGSQTTLPDTLVPLAVAAGLYFAVNTGLVAGAVALSSGLSPARLWQQSFAATAPSYLVAAGAAAAVSVVMLREAYLFLPLAALPMLLSHLAYSAWFKSQQVRMALAA